MNKHEQTYTRYRNMIEADLEHLLTEIPAGQSGAELREMLRYAVLGGGKRLRGTLSLAWGHSSGKRAQNAHSAAAAIEMLHAYTLIHDDLPEMDNAAERRGQASLHAKYGHWQALLAGDLLQATAYDTLAQCGEARDLKTLLWAGKTVCEGQYLDLTESGETDRVRRYLLISKKTGALFSAACQMGHFSRSAARYGLYFGIAFQLADDLQDKDGAAALFGEETIRRLITRYISKTKDCTNDAFLLWLADNIQQ